MADASHWTAAAGVIGVIGVVVGALINGMFRRGGNGGGRPPANSNGSGTVPARWFEEHLKQQGEIQAAILDEQRKTRSGLTSLSRGFHRLARALEEHTRSMRDGP